MRLACLLSRVCTLRDGNWEAINITPRLLLQLLRTAPVCREGEALPWKPFIILARTPLSVAGVVSFQYLSLSAIPCVSVFCHTLIHSSILRSLAAESLSRPTYRLLPFAFKPAAGRSSVLLFPMSSCWLGDSSGQCFHRSRQSEGSEAKAIDHFYDPFLFASLAALLRPEVGFIDPSQFFHSSNTDERFQHRI
ncbi:ATP-sensitive inward rectifier potassium channel1 [Striga asiatica]|uniref:ATP-sensitive inward rectifier potassium channel1 n=1 Tax=Striga asiatica TaxID=4170 RepID=A0A5A7QMG9_STRAF|nr:ATP-sensitive inward rectifier potassium channel1 [Striga asiatica]